jgi:gliding motility-associated-like protein
VKTSSFTCCYVIPVPDDVIVDEDSPELIVTPEEGIRFEAIDENTTRLVIFGRWGNLVFKVDNPTEDFEWNGRQGNGRMLPEGTYYYIVEGSISQESVRGYITLLN